MKPVLARNNHKDKVTLLHPMDSHSYTGEIFSTEKSLPSNIESFDQKYNTAFL
jgi:hypothetical protein